MSEKTSITTPALSDLIDISCRPCQYEAIAVAVVGSATIFESATGDTESGAKWRARSRITRSIKAYLYDQEMGMPSD